MSKRRTYLIVAFIFILAFLAGNLSYPNYLNQGIDFLNWKFNLKLPHFWDVPLKLGLDLQGGTHLIYEADLSNIEKISSLKNGRPSYFNSLFLILNPVS